ncbi:hypothetical protein [Auraticoccus monumenti]|uniref:YbaB/EbfC DNA-binding family protein n=1 Tax=Auraticoccus monumenti TaxID=675864 RepID=A0A1G6TE33_9ACTN|nr:hypothetical protein [Auraticoccus monumenti]SDD27331.1 hypothetical protein SAMN04489747_0596 [Auraticoccus monumenti]
MTGWDDHVDDAITPTGAIGDEPSADVERGAGEVALTERTGGVSLRLRGVRISDLVIDQALLATPDQLRRSLVEVIEQVAQQASKIDLRHELARQVLDTDIEQQLRQVDEAMVQLGDVTQVVSRFIAESLPRRHELGRLRPQVDRPSRPRGLSW